MLFRKLNLVVMLRQTAMTVMVVTILRLRVQGKTHCRWEPMSLEEWTVTVKSVDLDATEKILSENKYTQEPKPGNVFILLDMTITYTGDDPAGSSAFFADIAYVSPSGNTFNEMVYLYDSPDELDRTQTLYNGASVSGKLALEVPKDKVEDGVISIKPGSLADPSFVAVK